jgi:tryptophan halogenase
MKKVTIVGGGAAGWLTALYLNKILPESQVTLIESETIGILGAGEGSVPTLVEFLRFLEIDEKEFVVKTNATHKLGILFDNWNGDGKNYFHLFRVLHQKFNYAYDDNGELINEFFGYLYQNNAPTILGEISEILARNNKSPFIDGTIDGSNQIANYSYHFDAHLVAKFLREKAEERGVQRIEGVIDNFIQDSEGNIVKVVLPDTEIECDFVFDCSGFKRLLIGNLFKSPWKSYTDQLKINTVIAFQLPQFENKVEPYTKAVCMKNGWMWQIPLQNRIGCGYIFDKNYITPEQAKQEVEELLGHEVKIVNNIKFDAGAYREVWIKNCIAVGLSSAFTEPIEATSIFNAINQLWALDASKLLNYNKKFINTYNEYVNKMNDDVLDFLYFHYITRRKDSTFWKEYLPTTTIPSSLETKLIHWENSTYEINDFKTNPFGLPSWLQVGFGLDLFNKEPFITQLKKTDVFRMYKHLHYLKQWGEEILKYSIDEKKHLTK